MCKGTCNKVFHFDCIRKTSYRVNRKVYMCKPCARRSRIIAKKEKQEAMLEAAAPDDDAIMQQ